MGSRSNLELSQRILDMAASGIYRELIFEALRPIATQKQIRLAIAQAKQYGLYSVAELRDRDLGTYYQRDPEEYAALQLALSSAVPLSETEPLTEQLRQATVTIRSILRVACALSLGSSLGGLTCLFQQQTQLGWGLLWCGGIIAIVWRTQRYLAQPLISRSKYPVPSDHKL